MDLESILNPWEIKNLRKLLNLFHDEQDRPYGDLLTPTQLLIVAIIATRKFPRTQLILPTQYGKSLAVALGLIIRVTMFKEKWGIIAPTADKAEIIMGYFIEHTFDDILFSERLEYYDSKEKLKQERSKHRLTFRDAGEVKIFTANATNKQAVKKSLMGFGSPNVVLDESSLIEDDLYATAKRMIGGTTDNFLLEIGNPFYRNHFWRTWNGERYAKIFVDYHTALKEGRYSPEYIEEMREESFFDVLYECKFPAEDELLEGGYRRLVKSSELEAAFIDDTPAIVEDDKPILGIDVARGGANKTIYMLRYPGSGFAMKVGENSIDDLMLQADEAEGMIKKYGVPEYRTAIDDTGVGGGLTDIMKSRGYLVTPVMLGAGAESKRYVNRRAELHWEARKWIREGGRLVRDPGFLEIAQISYRENNTGKLQIEPKEDMAKRNIPSPDNSDAFILTFINTTAIVEEDDIDFA